MRDLTAEELALAPEWATHYYISHAGYVLFLSESKYQTFTKELNAIGDVVFDDRSLSFGCRRINGFDIKTYKFSDGFVKLDRKRSQEDGCISFDNDLYIVDLNKADAIAIAKHFKLKAEDLK